MEMVVTTHIGPRKRGKKAKVFGWPAIRIKHYSGKFKTVLAYFYNEVAEYADITPGKRISFDIAGANIIMTIHDGKCKNDGFLITKLKDEVRAYMPSIFGSDAIKGGIYKVLSHPIKKADSYTKYVIELAIPEKL